MGEGKLVRDRIPDIIRERGGSPIVREAGPAEYRGLLHAKLLEETREVLAADDGSAAEELADVLEVVAALADELGFDLDHVHKLREQKARQRGGFARRYVWEGNNS
jgi:predicted house-cleaning noncanonical NTP pyrophosphatase (MazG superfamily)